MNKTANTTPLTGVDKQGKSNGTRFNVPTSLLDILPTTEQRAELKAYFLNVFSSLPSNDVLTILVFSGQHVRLNLNGKIWQELFPICHECYKPVNHTQSNELGAYVSLAERDNYPGVDEDGNKKDLGGQHIRVCRPCFSTHWE